MKNIILYITSLIFFLMSILIAQETKINKLNLQNPNIPQVSFPNVKIKDDSGNILMEIIDEGSVGSIKLGVLPANNISATNKLYNVASELYWNGSPLGTLGNAGGWANTSTNIHTEDETKEVGIGTASPSDKLHIRAETGQNALRVQINSATKFRVLSNGGTSIGTNNTSPPSDGLYVEGGLKVGSNGNIFKGIVKLNGTTNSFNNSNPRNYPAGFTWLNTQVIALKIRNDIGYYKAISQDANDAFSVTLKVSEIEIIVPNNNFRNKQYQLVLMRIDD